MKDNSKRYDDNELAALFQRLFSTQDGKDVLVVLEAWYDKPSLAPMAAVDGIAFALLTQHRIGEQNVVKKIKTLVNKDLTQTGADND